MRREPVLLLPRPGSDAIPARTAVGWNGPGLPVAADPAAGGHVGATARQREEAAMYELEFARISRTPPRRRYDAEAPRRTRFPRLSLAVPVGPAAVVATGAAGSPTLPSAGLLPEVGGVVHRPVLQDDGQPADAGARRTAWPAADVADPPPAAAAAPPAARADTAPPATAAPALPPVGSRDAVRAAQAALARLGFYDGEVDGLSGPMTRRAVSAYRRDRNLPDGGIDARLLAQLLTAFPAAAP